MRLYRVSYRRAGGEHDGYSWHASKRGAERAARDVGRLRGGHGEHEVAPVEFALTRAGVLDLLNRYADHADNG